MSNVTVLRETPGEPSAPTVTGVANPVRLKAVAEAGLHGHLDDSSLDAIVTTLTIACRVPVAAVNVVTPNLQTYPAEVGIDAPCTAVPDHLSFCAHVVDEGIELIVPDAVTHPVFSANPRVQSGTVGSYAGVPLLEGGVVLGTVSIWDRVPRIFTPDELIVLRKQAQLASNALADRRSARTDSLTGLPNRALCIDNLTRTLSRLARSERGIAVMFVDVDHFKAINDTFGHSAGDDVLIELAHRMSAVLRPTDTLARFSGDEFVVVCEDIDGVAAAGEVAERLLDAVGSSISFERYDVPMSLSIGVALATSPSDRSDDLIRAADAAMYRAKQIGGSRWQFARPDLANGGLLTHGTGSATGRDPDVPRRHIVLPAERPQLHTS